MTFPAGCLLPEDGGCRYNDGNDGEGSFPGNGECRGAPIPSGGRLLEGGERDPLPGDCARPR